MYLFICRKCSFSLVLYIQKIAKASRRGDQSEVNRLNYAGAAINASGGSGGTTPLMDAVNYENASTALVLLQYDASATATDYSLQTALHYAARWGMHTLVGRLVNRGAVVDARDNFEETPLMMAADFGHSRTVQVLLQAGADPSLVNRDGLSAEGLASKEHYEEVISILREAAQPAIPLPPAAPNQACPACHHLATPPQNVHLMLRSSSGGGIRALWTCELLPEVR